MDSEFYKVAADACSLVRETNTDLGTTEFNMFRTMINGDITQVLAIAPTNEFKDWLVNFNLLSWDGVKLGSYKAAKEIRDNLFWDPNYKLLVCGFSKGAGTAIAFNKLFNADYCVAFSPPPVLRRWSDRNMDNAVIFVDPDDPVSKAGIVSFGHPKCPEFSSRANHIFLSADEHSMEHWGKFVEELF